MSKTSGNIHDGSYPIKSSQVCTAEFTGSRVRPTQVCLRSWLNSATKSCLFSSFSELHSQIRQIQYFNSTMKNWWYSRLLLLVLRNSQRCALGALCLAVDSSFSSSGSPHRVRLTGCCVMVQQWQWSSSKCPQETFISNIWLCCSYSRTPNVTEIVCHSIPKIYRDPFQESR